MIVATTSHGRLEDKLRCSPRASISTSPNRWTSRTSKPSSQPAELIAARRGFIPFNVSALGIPFSRNSSAGTRRSAQCASSCRPHHRRKHHRLAWDVAFLLQQPGEPPASLTVPAPSSVPASTAGRLGFRFSPHSRSAPGLQPQRRAHGAHKIRTFLARGRTSTN